MLNIWTVLSPANLDDHDVDVAEQHVPAELQELPDDLELERRDGVVLPRVLLRLRDLQAAQGQGFRFRDIL